MELNPEELDITLLASEPDLNKKATKIADLSADSRPRERGLKYGIHSLTTPELWALILRSGSQGNPITDICENIMKWCDGSLCRLERVPYPVLVRIKGLGKVKAQQVEAVMELIRRYTTERENPQQNQQIRTSEDIFKLMRNRIGNLPHEEIWAIFTNRQNKLIASERVTQGSAVASIFDVKKVIKQALLHDAQGVILCHNHPSGATIPSVQDDNITNMLNNAVKLMDMRMLDHLIVTTSDFYSYRDHGKLV